MLQVDCRLCMNYEEEKIKNSTILASKQQNLNYLTKKVKQYELQIQNLREQLLRNGYNENTTHSELSKLSNKLFELRKMITPLQEKVKTYNNLPTVVYLFGR